MIVYSFRPEDYDAIVALVTDKDWPASFRDWEEQVAEQRRKLQTLGTRAEEAIIDPEKFVSYCDASGIDYNETTLGAFAVKASRDQADGRA